MKSKVGRFLFFIVFLFLTIDNSYSNEPNLNFMNLSSKEGLSSNIVNSIVKDRYGFMWFATDDGLNKFDGKNFTVYRHNPADSTSIASSDILTLYEDEAGNLWIGTGTGVALYNRRMDSFINYNDNFRIPILSLTSDKSGKIWVAGYHGVSILDPKTGWFSFLDLKSEKDKNVVYQVVIDVFKDSKGRIWIGKNDGLYLYLSEQNTFKHYKHSESDLSSLTNNQIKEICEDSKGNIWVGTNNGLSMLGPDGKSFINYKYDPSDKSSLNSNLIYSIASDPYGNIWVGTEEGLNILNPSTNKIKRVERSGRNSYSLVGKSVKSMLIDKQGIYWVATFRGGVNKYDKNLAFFDLRQSNRYDPFGLSSSVVTSFIEADNNKIYVGTDGGGLNLFDISKGTFNHISLLKSSGIDALSILTMEKVGNEIWIGTFLKGLYIFNTETGITKQFIKGDGPQNISGNDVFCIKRDSKGNVWLGTNGQGVNYYDIKAQKFYHFGSNNIEPNEINLNGYIRAIEEDNNGNIWVGAAGGGIVFYNPKTGYSKIFNKENSKLPNDNITTIHKGKNNVIWIGSAGGGIISYDQKNNLFNSYTEKDGLSNDLVYKILEDKYGKLWVSTNKGISSFDPQTKKIKNYSYYNGIQRSPFVLGAGLKLNDGRMFFGGTDGFNFFNPGQLYYNRNTPKVILTDLKIANQSVIPSEEAPINEHISVAKEIKLDYKQNFSLSFVALNFTSPEENKYFYKLENFDKEWNEVGAVNTAVYTNLDPGEYVFKVKAVTDSNDGSSSVTSIKIYVKPPFWLTYYAYALYVLLATSTILYIRYRGIQKLKFKFALEQERLQVKQMIEQERLEAERLHEFDQLKIKFLTNLSHEFRTPISLIMGPVEQLLHQETSPNKSDQLNMIRRNAKRLLNLVNQLLDFRNIKSQEQELKLNEGDFIGFSKDVAESFKYLAERKHINFEFKSSMRSFFTTFDHDKIERILFNLLSNAFKFTLKDGLVLLKIDEYERGKGIKVTLSDSGIGIEESEKDKIFERFYQSEGNAAILNQGSGIGLSITKEFIRMHGGNIDVESIEGKGSVFTIYFPFRKIEDTLILEEDAVISGDVIWKPEDIEDISNTLTESCFPVVLLVEDNDDFRSYLKENLKNRYRIVEASNGKEGWQKVLSAHPDVVVSDISMPHVSGIELCKKIKSDKRTGHIPVLLLTALTGEEDQLIGLETGANDYMTKPFNFEILNIKIRNLLKLNESLKTTYSKRINVLAPDVEIKTPDTEILLNKVVQYIESNLTNSQLSVEELSRYVGMSRGSLYTKVLELTGETPVEFIRSVKLDKAAILLEKSDLNVSQICYSVGFATPNYFARAFKSKFNMLPSEYINLKRQERGCITK